MPKYTLYETKDDYQKLYDKLEELDIDKTLDWIKIKKSSYNSLDYLVSLMERKNKENQI